MGELLDEIAAESTLLDAWHEVRNRAATRRVTSSAIRRFDRHAATELASLSRHLEDGTYRPGPVLRAWLRRADGGSRPLGIPNVADRVVERAALNVIDPVVDSTLLPWSFGFRRGLGMQDAIEVLATTCEAGATHVVRADFARCFESIPHRPLFARLDEVLGFDPELVALLRRLVRRKVHGGRTTSSARRDIGLQQGAPISPLLTNLYLDQFDRRLLAGGHRVIRYADDFAIDAASKDDAGRALAAARTAATAIGLELTEAKSAIQAFEEGVDFLGTRIPTSPRSPHRARRTPAQTTVYVTDPDCLIRSRGERFRIERQRTLVGSFAYRRTRQLVLVGRVSVTTPFLQRSLNEGVDLVFLSPQGRYFGRMQPAVSADVTARRAQYRRLEEPSTALCLARAVVSGKVANMRVALLRGARRSPGTELRAIAERLNGAQPASRSATSVAELMGVEGSATRSYYRGFDRLLGSDWTLTARRRRPPPDPVNSALSFGYTLLLHDVIAALEVVGLDPYAGFLHRPRRGRPGLALDLMEEFRPGLVDSTVLRAFRTGTLKQSAFRTIRHDENPTCMFTRAGLQRFVSAYEHRVLTLTRYPPTGNKLSYREIIGQQAERFRTALLHDEIYQPFTWK